MRDVTEILLNYLEAKRHLWNKFFRNKFHSITECGAICDYEAIDRLLFSGLVLTELKKSYTVDYSFGNRSIKFLKVVPNSNQKILNMMVCKPTKELNRHWQLSANFEITKTDKMEFIEFFEWDRYGFVSYPLVRVSIKKLSKYPELVGGEALIDISSIKFFF